jgi:hypothetical protein
MPVAAVDLVCSICRYWNRPLRNFGTIRTFLARRVTDHFKGAQFSYLFGGQKLPIGGIGMLPIEDGLKMEVAAC